MSGTPDTVRLSMLPLTDAAPLVVAQDQGFFAEQGLDVRLELHPSWAAIRDALQLGTVDGAQLLPLMPAACTLGLDGIATPISTLLTLNLNGNAISLAQPLYQAMLAQEGVSAESVNACDTSMPPAQATASMPLTPSAAAFARLVRQRQRDGLPRLRLAHVHPYSSHHYLLRGWLASSGLDPDTDVALRVIPPPLMVEQVTLGNIDGFCVGAPWSDAARSAGVAWPVCRCEELWPQAVEKVLGMRTDWVEAHPKRCAALVKALIQAADWLDENVQHRRMASQLLSSGGYLALAPAIIEQELLQRFSPHMATGQAGIRFAGPLQRPSHDALDWYARQVVRWGAAVDEESLLAAIEATTCPNWYDQVSPAQAQGPA